MGGKEEEIVTEIETEAEIVPTLGSVTEKETGKDLAIVTVIMSVAEKETGKDLVIVIVIEVPIGGPVMGDADLLIKLVEPFVTFSSKVTCVCFTF